MATPLANLPSTLVIVQSLGDFPTAVADVITLEDNYTYQISGEVDISPNRIVLGVRSSLAGTNRVNDRIISDTTGVLLTASSGVVSAVMNELGFRCPNGTLVAFSDTGVAFLNCSLGPCVTGGIIATSGAFPFTARTTNFASTTTSAGFTFSGTSTGTFRIVDSSSANCAGTLFDLGSSVWGTVQVANHNAAVSAGQTFMAGTAGTNLTNAGLVSDSIFTGAGTYLSGFDATDSPWVMHGNIGITNTAAGGAGDLLAANNLSDLTSASTARTNLGLGTAATTAASAYATAAQGATADTALQSIADGSITLAKQADVATATVFYRKTAGTGVPEVQTVATLKTDLGLTGTNSGDQTSVTGNAGTATALQTPRTINGVAFDGTANISITAAAADPSYTPGSFTVATGTGRLIIKRLQLTTTERATIAGTARLRLT